MKETKNLEKKICYKLTKACEGVDRTKKVKEELEVNINDRKQKVSQGSASQKEPETMHVDINDKGAADRLVQKINEAVKNKKQNEVGEGDLDDDEEMEDENLTDKPDNDKTEL